MFKIVIDPGHGGIDPGASGYGLKEKDITLKLAQEIMRHFLSYDDTEIVLTRASNVLVTLDQRCLIANQAQADMFLSIHVNAGHGTGFESYIHPGATIQTREYQAKIHAAVMAYLRGEGLRDRGMKEANFQVLRETKMPAVLLENLFIDNEKDTGLLKSEQFLNNLAGSIAQGVINALDLQKAGRSDKSNILPWAKDAVSKAIRIDLVNSPELLTVSEQKTLVWFDRLKLLEKKVI